MKRGLRVSEEIFIKTPRCEAYFTVGAWFGHTNQYCGSTRPATDWRNAVKRCSTLTQSVESGVFVGVVSLSNPTRWPGRSRNVTVQFVCLTIRVRVNLTISGRINVGAAKTWRQAGNQAAEYMTTAAGFLREAVGSKNRVDSL